jgi:hypothetical protein
MGDLLGKREMLMGRCQKADVRDDVRRMMIENYGGRCALS